MLAKINSTAVIGLDCAPVEVEVDVSKGLPGFLIVGLPDKAVEESRERVRSAIKNSQQSFPSRKITINLAPADLRKAGPAYDLPMAAGILVATGQLPSAPLLKQSLFIGELALNGQTRHTTGILSTAIMAKERGLKNLFVPTVNAAEAALVEDIKVFPVAALVDLIRHLKGEQLIPAYKTPPTMNPSVVNDDYEYDFAYVKGQENARRAMEIAAAGGHNVLLFGPPGAGKTLLARALPSIMPPLIRDEALEVTKIYSVAGLLPHHTALISQRPFRSPHHTASDIALVGGGSFPKPGEVSLAHRGVLFLDELPEFSRPALEALRQPLEDRIITVSRATATHQFPAYFILIAAQNPCPCGHFGDKQKACICTTPQILKYQKKISGPLIDRIDLHVEVPAVEYTKMLGKKVGESSRVIRRRVTACRQRQRQRFTQTKIKTNAEITIRDIDKFCPLDKQTEEVMKNAVNQFHLSVRSYHRILKLSRTIADLANSEKISVSHLSEALQYRPKENRI